MYRISPQSCRGFTIIEMAVVLLIASLVLVMAINLTGSMRDTQNRQLVQTKLSTLDTAIANYVAINKRLPCPANGTIASGALNAGVEAPSPATGTCNPAAQTYGVVPWVTLGLTEEDATDPWFARMTYRVDPALTQIIPLLMDMSNCDPAATGPTGAGGNCLVPVAPCTASAACTSASSFLNGKGLDVWDGKNGAAGWASRQNNRGAGTGAAYVIISHGTTGAGAYNKNGAAGPLFATQQGSISIPNPVPPPATLVAGNDEIPNMNGQNIALPSAQLTTYRDAPLNDIKTQAHFDDYLSHPTIMFVLNKANLGPRVH
ncbi:type II secretion system protein [Undibacterium sp. Di26W]|uniref:type II secretion system protein n=1 Tax=Undibacterium sp. Di26W TaxID=3413035 RepID=UPI003BF12488